MSQRTLGQIIADLRKAEEAEQAAKANTEKFRSELQKLYQEAKTALGIEDVDPTFFR